MIERSETVVTGKDRNDFEGFLRAEETVLVPVAGILVEWRLAVKLLVDEPNCEIHRVALFSVPGRDVKGDEIATAPLR